MEECRPGWPKYNRTHTDVLNVVKWKGHFHTFTGISKSQDRLTPFLKVQ